MEIRKGLTFLLLLLGLILALLPLTANRSFTVGPDKLLSEIISSDVSFSVDQVAKFIISEDSTVRIIDLRSPDEFKSSNIPGSINIPYSDLVKKDPDTYLNNKSIRNVFYSNGDLYSNYALVFTRGLGYKNSFVMKGGLKEWICTIMDTKFTGDRISARENAIFEIRAKAGKLFIQLNSLPDSLKKGFVASNKFSARKLDGGCE